MVTNIYAGIGDVEKEVTASTSVQSACNSLNFQALHACVLLISPHFPLMMQHFQVKLCNLHKLT